MRKNAFTLIEALVVLTVLSLLSVLFVDIFFRTLRGNSKAQVEGVIKQNGQSALETMDKIIRGADKVICPLPDILSDALVVQKNDSFIRFKFFSPMISINGFIFQDDIEDCGAAFAANSIPLTNTDSTNGASVLWGYFLRNTKPGYKDLITIIFSVGPGINIPPTLTDAIDPVQFNTTVELR